MIYSDIGDSFYKESAFRDRVGNGAGSVSTYILRIKKFSKEFSLSIPSERDTMLILKEDEVRLVEDIQTYLDSAYPEESKVVRERFRCLQQLGEAISQYPSIHSTQILRGSLRTEEDLVDSLLHFKPSSHLLHIPARVVAVRGFLVTKFQSFSMLAILVEDIQAFSVPLRSILFSIICTLLAEDVYFSCLEDPDFSFDTKFILAQDLIALWDNGKDLRSAHHFPALQALWIARDATPPVFGTMNGTSELIRISMDMKKDWQHFLVEESVEDETQWALEEFLFGLSYEEINSVRTWLERFGLSAVSSEEVRSYIGQSSYGIIKGAGPRAFYDFYIDRRDAALFRKRISAPGPKQTLEEIYLKYRITFELSGCPGMIEEDD